jgi:choline-sulfatase
MAERPDILFLFSDQHAQRVAGAYGDAVAETPALDALAAGGVTFDNCHTPAPICGPARMAMLTARHPHRTGVLTNNDILPSDMPTYAHALGAAGYHAISVGRLHALGPDQWHGFATRDVGDHSPAWPGVGRHDMGVLRRTHGPNRISLDRAGRGNSAYQNLDEAVLEAALNRIDALAAARQAGDTRPFFLQIGFMLPHPPYVARPEVYDRFAGRVPPPALTAPEAAHPWLRWWHDNRGLGDVSAAEADRARTAYYALVGRLDLWLGQIRARLEQTGLARNLLTAYASDHGDHLGERGLWWKHTMYDDSVKVPLILHWPEVLEAGARRAANVDLLDLAAGFVEAAGAPPLPGADGRSLLPLARDPSAAWEDRVFSEYCVDAGEPYSGGRATQQRMIRAGRWKYIYYHGMPPQLFDMEADREERHDRAGDPTTAEVEARLRAAVLTGWQPEDIAARMEARAQEKALLRAWAEATDPPDPLRWHFDPAVNRVEGWEG